MRVYFANTLHFWISKIRMSPVSKWTNFRLVLPSGRFESSLGHRLSSLRFSALPQPLQTNAILVPELGHDRFLPNPCQFFIYLIVRRCAVRDIDIVLKETIHERDKNVVKVNLSLIDQQTKFYAMLIIVQRDATQSSLCIILQVHSTCFGCQPHPSSGVHKTVTTASGTVQLAPSNMAKLAWPRWREVAAQYRRL